MIPAIIALSLAATGAAVPLDAPLTVAAEGAIPGAYIVLTKKDAVPSGITPSRRYSHALNGFAAALSPAELARVRRSPDVISVEQDAVHTKVVDTTQSNPPSWGIDRIDQRNRPLSSSYTYNVNGSGVHAYVIDTGILTTHSEFGGRASFDYNSIDSTNTDCAGHGTHVAGIIGSNSYGVAKGVRLHAVKFLDCNGSGTTSSALAAVNWVTANAQKPAVANTSWGLSGSASLETAIRSMISSGVFLATSGGNTGANSCTLLPRKVETALVAANSDTNDARNTGSSTGACIDLYAPGTSIRSTLYTGGNGLASGTSMSAPHVAGVAALYKARYGDQSSATVHSWIVNSATPNVITGNVSGTANRLLYTNGL